MTRRLETSEEDTVQDRRGRAHSYGHHPQEGTPAQHSSHYPGDASFTVMPPNLRRVPSARNSTPGRILLPAWGSAGAEMRARARRSSPYPSVVFELFYPSGPCCLRRAP